MSFHFAGLLFFAAGWGVTVMVAYAAGARAAYWRGVARGQHNAGLIHTHVLAHTLYGTPIPPLSVDGVGADKKSGPN